MSEQRLREFADRAESLVTIPDLDRIERGGDRLRRKRLAFTAGAVAAVVGVAAALTSTGLLTRAGNGPPVAPVRVVAPWPGGVSQPALDAGTYELDVSDDIGAPNVQLTVPDGWDGWYGPSWDVEEAFATLLVLDVNKVVVTACKQGSYGMEEIGEGPDALVTALTRIPRHRVVVAPEPDDRFGYPATYLRLEAGRARCPFNAPFELLDTTNALIHSGGPNTFLDLWVVDVEGYRLLVLATATETSPDWLKSELASMVDSVKFVPTD